MVYCLEIMNNDINMKAHFVVDKSRDRLKKLPKDERVWNQAYVSISRLRHAGSSVKFPTALGYGTNTVQGLLLFTRRLHVLNTVHILFNFNSPIS